MAGTTTYYGISYPTNTDYVKDGATAMQTIADGFDSAVAIPTYNNQTGTSYTFVLADAGKTVTSNNASAVTFTIPPQASVAWANNTTLTVRNLGAGVVTIAGGAGVTVTNTAQTVAQYGSVRIIRTASNAWTVVPASGGASGLTLITQNSFTAATSFSLPNNTFTSTYRNYKIIVQITAVTTDADFTMRLRASGTDNSTNVYGYNMPGYTYAGAVSNSFNDTGTTWVVGEQDNSIFRYFLDMDIIAPQVATPTFMTGSYNFINKALTASITRTGAMQFFDNTSFDSLSFISSVASSITGVYYVYGYSNS